MTIFAFSALVFLFSFCAGLLGALTGLGGGVVIIPVLVLVFHINIHYAMGASLISVISTSSGAAAAYMREGYTNLRIGIFLEVAAVIGAVIGALLIAYLSKTFISVLFGLILFFSALTTLRRHEDSEQYQNSHPLATTLQLNGDYPHDGRKVPYKVQHVPLGFLMMMIAGLVSGLLGIGSGTLKVLAMDQALRLPYKVSTTTSNFMIGITGAASAGVYFTYGYINPSITFPVMLGVLAGSFVGAKLLTHLHSRLLRIVFSLVLLAVGVQMLYEAFSGAFS